MVLLISTALKSQSIKGKVYGINGADTTALAGAVVQWRGMPHAVITKENGYYEINYHNDLPYFLRASFIGYKTDSISIADQGVGALNFYLTPASDVEAVVVEGEQASTDIDPFAAQQLQVITSKELLKAACCNLSESFETNASIDVSFNDAVTGSKQISLLGLDGIYTQINWENMPLIRGVGEYYGLTLVPGTWIDGIHIGKGAGSVINGYESMAGQINLEFNKPDTADELYLNAYQNVRGRSELNANYAANLNDRWSTAFLAHGNLLATGNDHNGDLFLDTPKGGQINVFNRWKYVGKDRLRSQYGLKYLYDEKLGGQTFFDKSNDLGTTNNYGVSVQSSRWEGFMKQGLIFPEKPYKSIGFILNANSHDQDAWYGQRQLNSKQRSLYANLINQTIIGNTNHTLRYGGNYQHDEIDEVQENHIIKQKVSVPGVFTEYNYNNSKNVNIVVGLRADYVNATNALEVSPRVHVKLNTDGENAIRLSTGRGFRVPTIFADNANILASSRSFSIQNPPKVESSWNFGAALTRYFRLNGRDGTFSADFYRTTFQDQLIADTYSNAGSVTFMALDGKSYSNSFQTELNYELLDRFDVRAAYKRDAVKQTYMGKLLEKPLTPKNRTLLNLAYALPFDRWKFDATGQWVGKQRLPATALSPDAFSNAVYSPNYFKMLAQVTARIKDWEVYSGGENITGFKQSNPIIGAEDPFGSSFDATNVWGPVDGANYYVGFRFRVKRE